jgi:hypothetical protein
LTLLTGTGYGANDDSGPIPATATVTVTAPTGTLSISEFCEVLESDVDFSDAERRLPQLTTVLARESVPRDAFVKAILLLIALLDESTKNPSGVNPYQVPTSTDKLTDTCVDAGVSIWGR